MDEPQRQAFAGLAVAEGHELAQFPCAVSAIDRRPHACLDRAQFELPRRQSFEPEFARSVRSRGRPGLGRSLPRQRDHGFAHRVAAGGLDDCAGDDATARRLRHDSRRKHRHEPGQQHRLIRRYYCPVKFQTNSPKPPCNTTGNTTGGADSLLSII
jgi:hypothetical protein